MSCHLANLKNSNKFIESNASSTVGVAQGGLYIEDLSFTSFSYNDLVVLHAELADAVKKGRTPNLKNVTPILQTQYIAYRRKFSDMDILNYIEKTLPQYKPKNS